MKRIANQHWHVFIEAYTENLDEAISRDLVGIYKDNVDNLDSVDPTILDVIKTKEEYIKELNSSWFRCDDFKEKHDGLHVLFSGDSVTFGEGLTLDEVWSHQVYSNISKNTKTSGYFNLAVPGTGTPMHIFNMFKYFKKYGNPDYIFFNMSEMHRFYDYLPDMDMFTHKIYSNATMKNLNDAEKDSWVNTLSLLNFNLYFMLEQYCVSNNIKLYTFSWDASESDWNYKRASNKLMKEWGFKTFHNVHTDQDSKDLFLLETVEFKDHPYVKTARDNSHQGVGIHRHWANRATKWFISQ
jgi:hypothetical protein